MILTPLLLFATCLVGAEMPADFTLPDPPGSYVHGAKAEDAPAGFRSGSPVVATSYFYWYDVHSKAHIIDLDGTDALTDHPPTLEGFSYKSVDWHAGELEDMIAAGIDAALAVYWGTPGGGHEWSDAGLPPLVGARERLLGQGKRPPAIGMFYDTSTLQYNGPGWHVDLTTHPGRLWFYGTIRDFFSLIPPEHRATVDGKPLVLLYASAFAKDVDEALFPAVRAMFRRDFGTDLFLIKMVGWPGDADSQYAWGAALGPKLLDTAGIGPGYDHSAVPGRTPLVRPRDEGRFYEFGWRRLLGMDPATRPWLVHLETWNEFHEGTEICETVEYGRQYIELTRQFADVFHARGRLDPADFKPPRDVLRASPGASEGITILPQPVGDGPVVEKTVAGEPVWSTAPNPHSPDTRYLYFDVEDYSLYDGDEAVEITVVYYDAGPSSWRIDYDSADPHLEGLAQQFRAGHTQPVTATAQWKQATVVLPHARFSGRANNADFRLAALGGDLAVREIVIGQPQRNE